MFFRYFKDVTLETVTIVRVLSENAGEYENARLDNDDRKFADVTFAEWWATLSDDAKGASMTECDPGEFWSEVHQNGEVVNLACSLETGEPIEEPAGVAEEAPAPVDASEAPAAEAPVEGAEAPATPEAVPAAEVPASEAVASEGEVPTPSEPAPEEVPAEPTPSVEAPAEPAPSQEAAQ